MENIKLFDILIIAVLSMILFAIIDTIFTILRKYFMITFSHSLKVIINICIFLYIVYYFNIK